MKSSILRRASLLLFALAAVLPGIVSQAAEKPDKISIGITAFLSGPASVFGEPAKAAAEIMINDINAAGGISGVPLEATFVDEGAGGEQLLAEYRRLVQDVGVDAMFSAISSGNCNKIAPLAEDLKILNIMWDCGTQRIFEEGKYHFVFRTQANATPEMLATVLYLLKTKPDFKTIAVVNQDYAWGRESWKIFSTALKALKPDVEIVAELFPKFGSPDYSTEISRLSALRPDVVFSTSWGGDLDTLVRQSAQRGLMQRSTFVLPLVESSLQRLGKDLPEGVIVGGRGDHYFLHPEFKNDADFQSFNEKFKAKTGSYPIYPVFHISQALAALKGAYEKAITTNNGEWPDHEQVIEAMNGLEFKGLGRTVRLREDHQGLEDQMLGTTKHVPEYDFAVMDNMMIFPAEAITTPVGRISEEWVQTLSPDLLSVEVDTYQHGS